MKCAICGGLLKPVKEKLLLTIEVQDVLITNLDMLKCQKCEELYLEPESDQKVEDLVTKYKQGEIVTSKREIIELKA